MNIDIVELKKVGFFLEKSDFFFAKNALTGSKNGVNIFNAPTKMRLIFEHF